MLGLLVLNRKHGNISGTIGTKHIIFAGNVAREGYNLHKSIDLCMAYTTSVVSEGCQLGHVTPQESKERCTTPWNARVHEGESDVLPNCAGYKVTGASICI